jgi:hypothetical protein
MVNQAPRTGNAVNSEAEVENVVDILSQISTATPIPYNEQAAQDILNRTTPVTGNMVGSDKKVYNIVDLLKGISAGSDVLKYKGSVDTYEDLPNDAEAGDVYNVLADDKNYAWTGTAWDDFGGAVTVALAACTDVQLTNLSEGDSLVWDNTAQKWVNKAAPEVQESALQGNTLVL